ncbi:7-carboxy-7-deazaguanine synthase QueE [Falsibacillus pallidus]|uniref:7-carboxy-7-deazaguanine synthase n=1 Tax=Falsibacillus pallidus TaxID=493781 RepID=A0A370GHN1_9BACI|nr:7-carboxy-7-deazaguanine synthase QueE [Falsibacillus pallidus]RDI43161.1 preQ(0) biosynthesis protein QueE [Falsibacillus pallidus]
MKKFPVIEIFGPTVQGEGMVIGQKTMFVRTAGCDYSCSWCDSAFTWDGSAKEDINMMTAEEIFSQLKETGGSRFSHVTISGGNPALLKDLHQLIDILHENGIKTALETQGSKWQDWFLQIDELTISPKPPSSLMKTDFSILSDIVEKLQTNERDFSLKVVIFNDEDLAYAKDVHTRYPDVPFYLQTGNDSLTETDDEKLLGRLVDQYENLIDKVMESSELNDVRVLPQLHTYVWGNKKGV